MLAVKKTVTFDENIEIFNIWEDEDYANCRKIYWECEGVDRIRLQRIDSEKFL